jgi:hypothetical protein
MNHRKPIRSAMDPPRFANLRTGGNLPRKRPGLIRDAIKLACLFGLVLAFYVMTP